MLAALLLACASVMVAGAADKLEDDFARPPDAARPWVYWYFMDGNMTKEGMTADLEAMKKAGIGGAIFLEVNIGVPRGPVDFMGRPWQELVKHAIAEADRLGIRIALGSGPGWCGAGGPWVKPEQSMQHLVASETTAKGPGRFDGVLPRPLQRKPFFGEGTLTPELAKQWREFYHDEALIAFPTPAGNARIENVDEKALYYRGSYSSDIRVPGSTYPGVVPFIPAPADFPPVPPEQCIASKHIIDLTGKLAADGRLVWDVPPGNWTIMRFGRTTTGQTTRPAPAPGLGFETDKFERSAIDSHFASFVGTLLKTVGEPRHSDRGLTTLHFDSWEMGSQNWSEHFRAEFVKRRGYDPLRFLPAMTGRVVDDAGMSERFLWDLRQTANELVVANQALRLKELGRMHHMDFSLEPYDLNPSADLTLGGVADVPQCEFWSKGYGPSTEYSAFEASSIGHTMGRPIIAAESFTSSPGEAWHQYPGSMKAQTDWALCMGVNRFDIHRYQHQPWLDRFPGMAMGPHGVYWERTQTWWDMVPAYHAYLTRCSQVLRHGLFVADVLYLAPEGAPHVFRPPATAVTSGLPDRLGYNFDGCSPEALIERASVKDGRIVFPDGMTYRLLVLPRFDTMTMRLLSKIAELAKAGATVIGEPPRKSPGLSGYPLCDNAVKQLAEQIWGAGDSAVERVVGKGRVIRDPGSSVGDANALARALWIWYPEGNPAASAPVGKRYFQRHIEVDGKRAIEAARFAMTADNSFELFVNGHSVVTGDNFHNVVVADVAALLQPGANTITVTAENTGDESNPAGLIGALEIRFRDGGVMVVNTDRQWTGALTSGGRESPAMELGGYPMSPWHLTDKPAGVPDIYPGYAMTAQVLAKMGVPRDFDADGGMRYIHRREGSTDIYFIANRENQPKTITCRFRVGGKQPEWWNPVTGRRQDMSEFVEKDGITAVPVKLDAWESGFVIFRKEAGKAVAGGSNFPALQTITTLAAPWNVSFPPRWGGPEKIVFPQLEDWSKRPEPGIRFYSGQAVYRTTFDALAGAEQGRYFLSLGVVKNMASVKLNGKDLGVLWCDPWRVEIPAGTMLARNNRLEITVANLWINRLIGDSGLPQDKRLTWTTYSFYKPNSPLQPSGLLGPVTVLSAGR